MTKEETLARLTESRWALHRAIEGLSEKEMTQIQVEGVWTIKEVLGHIASWEETCLEPLRRYADGGPYEVEVIEDYLTWNAPPLRHRTSRSPACAATVAQTTHPVDVILDELATVRQGIVQTASRLSARQWEQRVPFSWGGEGTIVEVLELLHDHEMEHVRNIQQWRGR